MRTYKPTYTKPMPEKAKIFTRKGKRFAKFKDAKGHTAEARLTKSGDKILVEVEHWHIQFDDNKQIRRELKGYTNEQATKDLADRIQDLLDCNGRPDSKLSEKLEQIPARILDELIDFGLLDAKRTAIGKPLNTYFDDFELWLKTTKAHRHGLLRAKNYVVPTCVQIRKIADNCRFKFWSDIKRDAVEKYLGSLSISERTYNSYVGAIKQFCIWMVDNERATHSPLGGLKRLGLDDKEYRRPLARDEVQRLLTATALAPERFGLTGGERAVLYLLAVETGLRRGDLFNLTVSQLDFDKCEISIEKKKTKGRRAATLPLKKCRATQLKEFTKGKLQNVKVFPFSKWSRTAEMIKADLKETEVRNRDGNITKPAIEFEDEQGRRMDFHALRHTFETSLAELTDAKDYEQKFLMLHSTKGDVTAGYRHRNLERLHEIIEQLPCYAWPCIEQAAMKATGTDGKDVDVNSQILSKSCFQDAHKRTQAESRGKETTVTMQKTPLGGSNKGDAQTSYLRVLTEAFE